jgi:hypothetical protein
MIFLRLFRFLAAWPALPLAISAAPLPADLAPFFRPPASATAAPDPRRSPLVRADGSRQQFRMSGEPVFDSNCRVTGYRGVGVEVLAAR